LYYLFYQIYQVFVKLKTGDIEYTVNQTEKGWIIGLINNKAE